MDSDDLLSPETDRVAEGRLVERDETYDHDRYGLVEVTGIWNGTHHVDSAHKTNRKETIIVRFSAEDGDEPVNEYVDTLDEFLEAIE